MTTKIIDFNLSESDAQVNVVDGALAVDIQDASITLATQDTDFAFTVAVSGVYAPLDTLGSKITLINIASADGKPVFFQNTMLHDRAEQTFGATLIIFNANPTASTITDNAPLNIVDADAGKVAATLGFTVAKDVGGIKIMQADDKSIMVTPALTSRTLYACLFLDSGTPTFATNDITILPQLIRD